VLPSSSFSRWLLRWPVSQRSSSNFPAWTTSPHSAEPALGPGHGNFRASWLLVHTSFALHYAHAYYGSRSRNGNPPLEFPGHEPPVYTDFLYFAIIVGMTSQTADVAISSTRMRRLAMAQGMIAFAFNTTLLALTVNIAAGLLG